MYNLTRNQLSTTSPLDWGPMRDSLVIVIPITIIYVLIFVTGVVGNISTCIVIARNKSMHTATNYYLFSLAISDLLLLITGLPPELYSIWVKYPYIFGETFCVMQGFITETSTNSTVLTITAFTVERYVAICHPFLSHTMSKLSRAVKYIVAIWMVAMVLAIPQAMSFQIVYGLADGQYVCSVEQTVIPHAFGISTLLFFVGPMSLITVLYVLIGLQLHKSTVGATRGNSVRLQHRVIATQPIIVLNGCDMNKDNAEVLEGAECAQQAQGQCRDNEEGRKNFSRTAQGTKYVVKMLVAVVVAFFICWAPFHAQRLLAVYGKQPSEKMVSVYRILTYMSGVLFFLSTSINPFLYHIMSHKFRAAFKETFKGLCCRYHQPKRHHCYANLSGRSSLLNSLSHTDSCSRQSSLRYLEAEMARLRHSERPLVVSFKRKKSAYPTRKPKQVTILDAELQEALDSLNRGSMRCNRNGRIRRKELEMSPKRKISPILSSSRTSTPSLSESTEMNNLEPMHICPVRYGKGKSAREMSDEEESLMCTKLARKDTSSNLNLTKSSTMSYIVNNMTDANESLQERLFVRSVRSNSCSQMDMRYALPNHLSVPSSYFHASQTSKI